MIVVAAFLILRPKPMSNRRVEGFVEVGPFVIFAVERHIPRVRRRNHLRRIEQINGEALNGISNVAAAAVGQLLDALPNRLGPGVDHVIAYTELKARDERERLHGAGRNAKQDSVRLSNSLWYVVGAGLELGKEKS